MKWKFVFNCNLLLYGHSFDECMTFVRPTGYKFFLFNGIIYDIKGNSTGITVSDMI